jgi:hypothetical protein
MAGSWWLMKQNHVLNSNEATSVAFFLLPKSLWRAVLPQQEKPAFLSKLEAVIK